MLSSNAKRKKTSIKNKTATKFQSPNKAIERKFQEHYDDSSDEESVNENNSRYDLDRAWRAKKKATNNQLDENDFLSFVVHVAGLQLLYAKEVNHFYYPLKQRYLHTDSTSSVEQIERLVSAAVNNIIREACLIIKAFVFIADKKDKKFSDIEKMTDQINKLTSKEITQLVTEHLNDFMGTIKNHQLPAPSDELNEFFSHLKKILTKAFSSLCQDLPNEEQDASSYEFAKICKRKITSMIGKLHVVKQNSIGKTEVLQHLEQYQGDNAFLAQALKKRLQHCRATGSVTHMLLREFEGDSAWQFELMSAYQSDLAENIKKALPLSQEEKDFVAQYFQLNQASLLAAFKAQINLSCEPSIYRALQFFYRPTLGKSHHFFSKDPYQFYANLRLSNRSQKRQALNLQHGIFTQDSVVRTWSFFKEAPKEVAVVELQQVNGKSKARKDLVSDLGSYDKMLCIINQIKDYFAYRNKPIKDQDIARWIRSVFQGKTLTLSSETIDQQMLLNKIEALAYLLFGCEAVRNPAMIIVNQMLLDLIINSDEYNFTQAFSTTYEQSSMKRAPMAPSGSVAVARALETTYREFMPHRYSYGGSEFDKENQDHFNKRNLIDAEACIVKSWLQLKYGKLFKVALKAHDVKKIHALIEDHYASWFLQPDKNMVTLPKKP